MKSNKVKIVVGLGVVVLLIAGRMLNLQDLLSVENINNNLGGIQDFAADNLILSSTLFIGIYTLAIALALPIATVLSLACGLVMGLKMGVVLVVMGATCGASVNFLLTRYILGEQIQLKYKDKLKKINDELDANGKNYLLMLRLVPLFPFFLINLAAGLSNVGFGTFVWTTALGIVPGTFAFVYLGASLNNLSVEGQGLPMHIILALVLIGIMALLPVLYKKYKSKISKA